ncbi:MAG: MoaD/ThiS family protein [Actinobacteria bacterium]|nr:MoaD/ThiS family protein [Actinomycetota bacterium]
MEVGGERGAGADRTVSPIAVTVQLHLGLERFRPRIETGRAVAVSVPAGSTVAAVLTDVCGLPAGMRVLVTVNGRNSLPADSVREGDRIRLFMPLSGG